ncbi:MAG TPA: glycosyltransferase family 2 protein [Gaiellaceae bacterium]|nr:glycosyltransferase family 2 protein [Gaiellaceae bacterium]
MRTAAVVVSHGSAAELERLLPALEAQVDELIVVANVPGSAGPLPPSARLIENERPRGFGANVNAGTAASTAELVCSVNPDAVPREGAVSTLRDFLARHPRAGVAGPRMLYPDGSLQPSRRRFPTVAGTLVRRTPLRRVLDPQRVQERHYYAGEAPTEPVQSDWMLGGFLMLRRTMLDELGGFDEGFFLYGEDIDLCYRAAQAGWERWYVPDSVVEHEHQAVTDRRLLTRRTLWHWRGILRFVRKHPERLRALG